MKLDWKGDETDRSDYPEYADLPDGRRASITMDMMDLITGVVGAPDPDDPMAVSDDHVDFCISVDSETVGSGAVYEIVKAAIERMLDAEEDRDD